MPSPRVKKRRVKKRGAKRQRKNRFLRIRNASFGDITFRQHLRELDPGDYKSSVYGSRFTPGKRGRK